MRWSRSLLGVAVLVLLLAAPAYGAGALEMRCPRCDHVDVEGHGLKPNATLILVVRDIRSGQEVVPETKVTTDSSGSFSGEYDVDLRKHPTLLGSVYNQAGTDVELAAHTRAQAPAHCAREASLPYSGAPSARAAALAAGLLAAGGLLLLLTRGAGPPRGRLTPARLHLAGQLLHRGAGAALAAGEPPVHQRPQRHRQQRRHHHDAGQRVQRWRRAAGVANLMTATASGSGADGRCRLRPGEFDLRAARGRRRHRRKR